MKFEIDLNDPNQLVKAESELVDLLDTIRYAINKRAGLNGISSGGSRSQIPPAVVVSDIESDRVVRAFVDGFGNRRFTSTDVYIALENQISRGDIRGALYRMMTATPAKINLIEAGKGRRPATYEKV